MIFKHFFSFVYMILALSLSPLFTMSLFIAFEFTLKCNYVSHLDPSIPLCYNSSAFYAFRNGNDRKFFNDSLELAPLFQSCISFCYDNEFYCDTIFRTIFIGIKCLEPWVVFHIRFGKSSLNYCHGSKLNRKILQDFEFYYSNKNDAGTETKKKK